MNNAFRHVTCPTRLIGRWAVGASATKKGCSGGGERGYVALGLLLLQRPHPRKDALCGDQFRERAAFDDSSLIEDENLVGIDDRRQPVRDDERRPILGDLPELGLDRLLGLRV